MPVSFHMQMPRGHHQGLPSRPGPLCCSPCCAQPASEWLPSGSPICPQMGSNKGMLRGGGRPRRVTDVHTCPQVLRQSISPTQQLPGLSVCMGGGWEGVRMTPHGKNEAALLPSRMLLGSPLWISTQRSVRPVSTCSLGLPPTQSRPRLPDTLGYPAQAVH